MKSKDIVLYLCILLLLIVGLHLNKEPKTMPTLGDINKEIKVIVDEHLLALVQLENEEYEERALGERMEKYSRLYPDMYVETIKPIIQIEEKKTAYITFDDGPSRVTNQILDVLKEEEIKATFFIISVNMNEDKIKYLTRMAEEGHFIGIHTYSHDYKEIYQSVEAYLTDFYKVYQFLDETMGIKSTAFRFPWGSINQYNKKIRDELISEMERRGFSYYDWNVNAGDSTGSPSAAAIKKNILKDVDKYQNPVILMHDSSINGNTAKILPEIIKEIKEKGYTFDTLANREAFHFNKK